MSEQDSSAPPVEVRAAASGEPGSLFAYVGTEMVAAGVQHPGFWHLADTTEAGEKLPYLEVKSEADVRAWLEHLGQLHAGAVSARTVRRVAVGVLSGAVLAASGIVYAQEAKAAPAGCVQQPWWYGNAGRMTTRTLCDGPIREDGSWVREREFYAAATYVPVTCSWSLYGGSCSGGFWLREFDAVEVYAVTPETVLPDEPGHLS